MAKQLNVNLGFTADTSQAAAQIQNLQNQLTGLMNSTNGSMNFGSKVVGDVNKASKAIAELKMHLQNATNVNTGTLDFTKLNESINKSGMNLQQYGDKLRSLGPAGQQAFNALAQSVAQSEIPIRRSNAALTEMWTTLKNTARWQISSSILHGFMGAINSAVGYAKDLNKSLNDIRIVTGASVDQMAQFADQANRSAKALSASTTEYTKASLIYYQQGLDAQAVKERTDITIKMANASGQSAEIVSDQMTAVWNNFAKGGEDLERFADVMVRLGADTASSSDEIAQGLEKFAAIGDLVGLSFDNAAAALATVTATTRQSADVVGTAFKTIFARIQGLKLGETLEDGTDLNKYSEALSIAGISVKEQNGELKDMDKILAEMGAKWKTMSKDQQVALAQTVAGVRQYNQLVALMDNFDFYEQNLENARNAEGSLQEQADIYAESWQAASDRVKAATQGIYEDLLNDEAFIDVLNTIEKILTYVDNLIDGLGGLGGVLTTVGALLTRAFSAQIAQSMTSMVNGIKMMTAAGREQAQQQKAQFMKDSADTMRNMSDGSNEGNMRATMMEDQLRLQTSMIENSERMSAEEQQINQMLLDRQRILSDNAIAAAKELDAATEAKSDATFNARVELAQEARGWAGGDLEAQKKNLSDFTKQFNQVQQKLKQGITARVNLEELRKLPVEGEKGKQVIDKIKQAVDKIDDAEIKEIVNSLDSMELNAENVEDAIAALTIRLREMQSASEAGMMDENNEWMLSEEAVHGLSEAYEDEATAALRVKEAEEQANQARDQAANSINNATGAQQTWADQMVAGANVVMSLMSVLQAFSGIIDVATNPDMSAWEKFLSIGSSLAMMFVMLAPLLQGTNLQFLTMAATSIAGALGVKTFSAAEIEAAISGNMAAAGTATFATALWTLLWPIGLVMAAIAALVLVVGGLIKLFKSFDEGEKLKRLEEETQNASEAFDRTKEKINETKTALDSLESGYETIEKLKEGTLEWYEAIGNVNAEVMKLVETYPELAQYISSDNGILKINQQGQDWLDSEMNTRYATAANNVMSTKIREKEKKYEIGKSNYIINNGSKWWTDPEGGLDGKYEHSTQLMEQMYVAPQIGEMLFTTAGAQGYALLDKRDNIADSVNYTLGEDYNKYSQEARDKFIDSLGQIDWKNTDAIAKTANEIFGENFKAVDFSDLSEELLYQRDNMEEFLAANKDHIKEQKELQDSIKKLQDTQFESVLSSMGSTRTADEGKELLGGRTYEDIKAETKTSVEETVNKGGMGGWQDHKNYTGNEKWIQDFMKQMGASDYVAQRGGEMVLKIDGEEQSFSRDEVINTLTDMYSTGAAQEEIKQALIPNIQEAYNIATEGLTAEQLVNLDEMARGIKEGMSRGFEGSKEELDQKVNEMTQGIGKAYGSDIEALVADTSHINFDDTEIQRKITGLTQQMNEGTISAEEYRKAIKEIDAIGELDSLSDIFDNAAAAMGGSKEEIAQNAAEMQKYAKHLMEVSKESDELSDELATNADSAADLAVEVTRINQGVDKLADGIEDWSSILKKSSKTSQEYCQALSEMRVALADVLDVNADLISNDFMVDPGNLALIEQAAKGSGEAIDALRAKMDEELILNITTGQTDEFIEKVNELDDVVQDLAANLPDIEVGAILQDEGFLEAANNLVQQSGMTADEANAYFAGIGYEPVYNTEEIPDATSMESPNVSTTMTVKSLGFSEEPISIMGKEIGFLKAPQMTIETESTPLQPTQNPADMRLTSFSGDGTPPQIKGMRKKASGGMNNYSKSNSGGKSPGSSGGSKGGGGGGSNKGDKVKKQPKVENPDYKDDSDKTKLEDELERYYYITNQLEDLNRELDKLSNAKDDAWGPNRLKAMDKEISKLKEVYKTTKQYAKEIETNLASDKTTAAGYGAQFDTNGVISNYDSLMTQWVEELNTAKVTNYNSYEDQIVSLKNQSNAIDSEQDADGSQKNALEAQIEALEDKRDTEIKTAEETFEARKKALEQYEETRDLLADTNAELEEQFRQIQQLNYEKIMYKVEYKIEINDRELELLDKKIEAAEKRIFKDIEAFSLINTYANDQLKIFIGEDGRDPLKMTQEGLDELEEKYQLGLQGSEDGISEASYVSGLMEFQSGLLDSYDTVVALDEKMQEYYGNAINDGIELIHKYEAGFDGFLDTLDHYSNIMTLIGQEKNYEGMNAILETRMGVLSDYIASTETTITNLQSEIASYELALQDPNLHPDTAQFYKEQLLTLNSALREESRALNGYFEEMGEAANQILKNNVDATVKELRDKITHGIDLEYLMKNMDRLSTYQEDYLTNTNKMYETNKLISSAQLAIDKTQNAAAKQRYQQYIKYIESLQTSGNLSKQELQMAQAKYEILEAEIALEEARNAKSEVRLTRDSEGNFGYVYTANQDDVASTTQTYLDKQNELYNISLEGTQQYREKYLQNMQSMFEEFEALEYANKITQTLSDEEYEKQKLALQEYYGEQAKSYADLFNHAQWELSASSYSTLMTQNENFNDAQLSANKDHYSLMGGSDAQYIGGLAEGMSGLHDILETDLREFNMNSYEETDDNYVQLQIRDNKYYNSLELRAKQAQGYIEGQMSNPTTNSAAHHMNEFSETTDKAFKKCELAAKNWELMIKPLNERVGKSFAGDQDNSGLKEKLDEVTTSSDLLKDKLLKELHPAISETWRKANNMTQEWEKHRQKINEVKLKYMELATEIQNTLNKLAKFNQENAPSEPPKTTFSDNSSSSSSTPPQKEDTTSASTGGAYTPVGATKNNVLEIGDIATFTGDYYHDSWGAKPTGNKYSGITDGVIVDEKTNQEKKGAFSIHIKSADGKYPDLGWVKPNQLSGYDTGGYTGEWGPEGKVAVLHEKEIVLNAKDTENFLTAANILREVNQMLDTNALIASLGMFNLSAMTVGNPADQLLQQDVTIHADFPNVTDHNEIEMAIDNLINAASQYANRK